MVESNIPNDDPISRNPDDSSLTVSVPINGSLWTGHESAPHRQKLPPCLHKMNSILFVTSLISYLCSMTLLYIKKQFIWGTSLGSILIVGIIGNICSLVWRRGHSCCPSFDRFVFSLPLALFSFYASFVTHADKFCPWYIAEDDDVRRICLQVSLSVIGWIAVLSMAFSALEIDCLCDREVRNEVQKGWQYPLWHLVFRGSELTFRVTLALIFAECMRIMKWTPNISRWGQPALLTFPFVVLVIIYMLILCWANRFVEGRPRDNPIAVILVAITALGMNPVHFLARPGYMMAGAKAKQKFFLIRCVELVIFLLVAVKTWDHNLAADNEVCHTEKEEWRSASHWVFWGRKDIALQLLVAIVVHYLIINFHPKIGHALWQISGERMLRLSARVTNGESAPILLPGLCQALVELSGMWIPIPGLPTASGRAGELAEVENYEVLERIGAGTYGVVLRVRKENADGGEQFFAMKLLHTRGEVADQNFRTQDVMADRERDIFCRVWLEEETIDDTRKCGHPFIVRLYFFRRWDEPGQEFYMRDTRHTETSVKVQDTRGHTTFHLALMMEYCNLGNLENYLRCNFHRDVVWFDQMRRFSAEMLLALEFLHNTKNVVYRDLKLSNTLVVTSCDGTPHVKLGDFGFSKVLTVDGANRHVMQCSSAGTPYWADPDMQTQVATRIPVTATEAQQKSMDIYSYGTGVFALAKGYPYECTHPRCVPGDSQAPQVLQRTPTACGCPGCTTLKSLENQFPTNWGNGKIIDIVRKCVVVRRDERPTVRELKEHSFFTQEFTDEIGTLNFRELLRVNI